MKKITTYINSKSVENIVIELQKIGLDDIKVTKYKVSIKQDTCIEIYCGSIWVEKVKLILKKFETDNEWNENMFFVEDVDYNDNSYLKRKSGGHYE